MVNGSWCQLILAIWVSHCGRNMALEPHILRVEFPPPHFISRLITEESIQLSRLRFPCLYNGTMTLKPRVIKSGNNIGTEPGWNLMKYIDPSLKIIHILLRHIVEWLILNPHGMQKKLLPVVAPGKEGKTIMGQEKEEDLLSFYTFYTFRILYLVHILSIQINKFNFE